VQCDVIVVGAGPAGTLAATLLARAGVRVQLFDRARFPRSKLCGDTLNPGALGVLARHLSIDEIVRCGLPLDGMLLTGPGVAVRGRYGAGIAGRAITRRVLDQLLLDEAVRAGVEFQERTTITAPVFDAAGAVAGVVIRSAHGGRGERRARCVIAADGRESRLARSVSLSHHPEQPRRWAIGGYFDDAAVTRGFGEMHVRRGYYFGVAPVPGGLANVCLVVPYARARGLSWRDPAALLCGVVARDTALAERFAAARLVDRPQVLGPMAVETRACGVPGLLLAGDAAGFIDPITGDGLRFALEGATLTAGVALDVLTGRCELGTAPSELEARRRRAFGQKFRFNRLVRAVVAAPAAISGAAMAARVVPDAFRAVIRYAGDVRVHGARFTVHGSGCTMHGSE
jgi:flavin-dependent dehydrogenase